MGEGRVATCLLENQDEVTPECKQAMEGRRARGRRVGIALSQLGPVSPDSFSLRPAVGGEAGEGVRANIVAIGG